MNCPKQISWTFIRCRITKFNIIFHFLLILSNYRLIVERAFSIRENYRRLAIDCEFLTQTAEAMVGIAFIQIVLKRFF